MIIYTIKCSQEEYSNWVNGEIIKNVKSKLSFLALREQICDYFKSPICLNSSLSQKFYSTNFQNAESHFHQLGFNLDIPGLKDISFEKAMTIRDRSHSSFLSFQQKIVEDSKQLRMVSDEKTYALAIKEIENDYLKSISSTHSVLSSLKNLFSFNNLINFGLAASSFFTGGNPSVVTGLTLINGLYNAKKIVTDEIKNPMFFLKQVGNK